MEDIKLNSTVFHWPDSLNTVFEVNQNRLTNRRERAEEELKKKIAAFEEKLYEHNKEIETFRKKEVTADCMQNASAVYIHVVFLLSNELLVVFSISV